MNCCRVCDQELPVPARGRRPQYCGTRCRVAAHREAKRIDVYLDHLAVPVIKADRLAVSLANVPHELRVRDRWIRHKDKRPIAIGGWACSVTDPSHWGNFDQALQAKCGDGVGFVLNGDGVICLDLDDCVVDGVPNVAASRFIDELPNTYVEFSPSGNGLHVWGFGFMDRGRRFTADGLKVEAYPDGRYLTVTGDVYRAASLAVLDLQAILPA